MAEQLDFDPAMFGMKSNHGMLRSTAPPSQGSGANSVSVASGPRAVDSDPVAQSSNTYNSRGGQRGGRGGPNRGRGGGGNRGGRGRGGFNAGQQSGDGQPFKRQRFDNEGSNRGGRGFFKPSMLEDPWKHLS